MVDDGRPNVSSRYLSQTLLRQTAAAIPWMLRVVLFSATETIATCVSGGQRWREVSLRRREHVQAERVTATEPSWSTEAMTRSPERSSLTSGIQTKQLEAETARTNRTRQFKPGSTFPHSLALRVLSLPFLFVPLCLRPLANFTLIVLKAFFQPRPSRFTRIENSTPSPKQYAYRVQFE